MAVDQIQGSESAKGMRVALVVSRFNAFVTGPMLDGALEALKKEGASEKDITVIKVPGAWEIPLAVREIMSRVDAVVAIGAVIRGETAHFEYVAGESIRGCAEAMRESGIPVSLGILTTEDEKQATERAGGKEGNKGAEAALAAVEMANLRKMLAKRSSS